MNKINNKTDKNNFVYTLDRYTNKNIKVLGINEETKKKLKH
ncbi:MAG TPA: hypothetical protein VJ895_02875 [Candidatus Nanoarchaeia archaeon]|nr:hypothetical protein [Candidatus Nanoarchaeia archaeon]